MLLATKRAKNVTIVVRPEQQSPRAFEARVPGGFTARRQVITESPLLVLSNHSKQQLPSECSVVVNVPQATTVLIGEVHLLV